VIAATNRDLERAIGEGKFREDLFYRLNVFPLRLPPLRERSADIALLAGAFARKFAKNMGRSIAPLAPEFIRSLEAYRWPGNVRELQNVIERAVITAQNGRLNLDRALPESDHPVPAAIAESATADMRVRTAKEVATIERENILAALTVARWKIAGANGAAQLLDVKPTTLSSRMKALGIKRPK
jgi:transcriptional regulator with GAF, ATPase, and Fis domain